jgi:DNA ligase-1
VAKVFREHIFNGVLSFMSLNFAFNSGRRTMLSIGLLVPWLGIGLSRTGLAATASPRSGSAENVTLAKPWQATLNPADFLVSEKLDGVRAVWDGSVLRFRSGRTIAAPPWFVAGLPATTLDGELWLGRKSFDMLSGIVRKESPVEDEWRFVRYMVFDLPHEPGPFVQRVSRMRELLAASPQPWLTAVEQTVVSDAVSLQTRLNAVVAAGGEGLVLHRADALWASGRSDALRKLKPAPDEEGMVMAQIPGKGKYQGRMGALLLETPEGQRFALGTGFSDALRASPPPVGAMVTYRYRDRTASGLPKFASFLRVRGAE